MNNNPINKIDPMGLATSDMPNPKKDFEAFKKWLQKKAEEGKEAHKIIQKDQMSKDPSLDAEVTYKKGKKSGKDARLDLSDSPEDPSKATKVKEIKNRSKTGLKKGSQYLRNINAPDAEKSLILYTMKDGKVTYKEYTLEQAQKMAQKLDGMKKVAIKNGVKSVGGVLMKATGPIGTATLFIAMGPQDAIAETLGIPKQSVSLGNKDFSAESVAKNILIAVGDATEIDSHTFKNGARVRKGGPYYLKDKDTGNWNQKTIEKVYDFEDEVRVRLEGYNNTYSHQKDTAPRKFNVMEDTLNP